jgi:hypothetical protein
LSFSAAGEVLPPLPALSKKLSDSVKRISSRKEEARMLKLEELLYTLCVFSNLLRFNYSLDPIVKTDDVAVKKSKIHGKGVFALRNFKKGEAVLNWDTSHILSKEEVVKLSNKEKEYVSLLKGRHVVMQEPEKYLNHSCDANTNVGDFCDVAVRDIKKGEEITTDYIKGAPPGFKMLCTCGSKNCRGVIRARG